MPLGSMPLFKFIPKPFDDKNITYAKYNDDLDAFLNTGNMIVVNLPDVHPQLMIKKITRESKNNYYYRAEHENNSLIWLDLSRTGNTQLGSLHINNHIYKIIISDVDAKITRLSADVFGED